MTTAHFNGSPLVVIGGRAPDHRWGSGSLQEIDHPALLQAITKRAWTEHETARVGPAVGEAFRMAAARHRGPVFLDVSLEGLFGTAEPGPAGEPGTAAEGGAAAEGRAAGPGEDQPDPAAIAAIAGLLGPASRPVLVLGSGGRPGGADAAAPPSPGELRPPVIT